MLNTSCSDSLRSMLRHILLRLIPNEISGQHKVTLDPAAVGRMNLEGYLAGRKRMDRIAQRPITIG